jgi:hypothetical protein
MILFCKSSFFCKDFCYGQEPPTLNKSPSGVGALRCIRQAVLGLGTEQPPYLIGQEVEDLLQDSRNEERMRDLTEWPERHPVSDQVMDEG